MRRISAPLLVAVLLLQLFAPFSPAKAALPKEAEDLWNKVSVDLIMARDYFKSTASGNFSFFGYDSLPKGLFESTVTLVVKAKQIEPAEMAKPAPGEPSKTREQVINEWLALCDKMNQSFADWDEAFTLMQQLLEVRLAKDPSFDYKQYIELGVPSLALNDIFYYILGRGPVQDGYATGNACTIASVNAVLTATISDGSGMVYPYPGGPITSSLKDGKCFYQVPECQPAYLMKWTPSPEAITASTILNSTGKARDLVRQMQETLAAMPAGNANPIKGNVGSSVISLPLPLSDVTVEGVIGRVLNAVLGVVGAIALLLFVWGGISWMLAAGSPDKVGKAKQTITWAALGLIAIFSSYAILNLVIETFSK